MTWKPLRLNRCHPIRESRRAGPMEQRGHGAETDSFASSAFATCQPGGLGKVTFSPGKWRLAVQATLSNGVKFPEQARARGEAQATLALRPGHSTAPMTLLSPWTHQPGRLCRQQWQHLPVTCLVTPRVHCELEPQATMKREPEPRAPGAWVPQPAPSSSSQPLRAQCGWRGCLASEMGKRQLWLSGR